MILSPTQSDLQQFNASLISQGENPRYWRLNTFESWYLGTQYDGRPSFWSSEVPLRQRAPVVQSQFVRSSISRLANLVFGDRTFPRLKVEDSGYRMKLDSRDAKALQALVDELCETISLSKRMREVLTEGLKCGTACILVGLVGGRPTLRLLPAKWCTPTFHPDGSVQQVVVEFKLPDDADPNKWLCHRREITETYDRVYVPVPVRRNEDPKWGDYKEIPHNGCPVVWVKNEAEACCTPDQVDGHPLVEGLEDEVEALDMELSQLYRNALYNGDPQMVQIGVEGQAPLSAPMGPADQGGGGGFSFFNSVVPNWAKGFMGGGGSSGDVTKKAPGKLWKLPAGGDAKLVESDGSGAEIIKGAIKELRRTLTDSVGVVLFDSEALGSGDISGRTLALMHAPMLDKADNLRVEYGEALRAVLNAFLRLLSGILPTSQGVLLRTYDDAVPALNRLYGEDAKTKEPRWVGARISLRWGDYFEPSAQDRQVAVTTAMAACGGKPVLTRHAAVASVASMFGVQDVNSVVEELEKVPSGTPVPTPSNTP